MPVVYLAKHSTRTVLDGLYLVSAERGGANLDALRDGGVKDELRRDAGHGGRKSMKVGQRTQRNISRRRN
jgi:hypothetical protein